MRLIGVLLVFLVSLARAQETPPPSPYPSSAAVCGPHRYAITCITWVRQVTASPQFVSRCMKPRDIYWRPEGEWPDVCISQAGPNQACMAEAIVLLSGQVVCDIGVWSP